MRTKRSPCRHLILVAVPLLLLGCRSLPLDPAISFSLVPVADPGGPESLELICGSVRNGKSQDRVILYAFSGGFWWVQPFTSRPFTELSGDMSWKNRIHLGQQYTALLVHADYKPSPKLEVLPTTGNGVLAVATVPGTPPKPVTIHFSGYDWEVRQLSSNWGGTLNPYDPSNAWVDQAGSLHLKIEHRGDQWLCADIGLKESLGQGSYSFTVRDVSHLDPAAVLWLYTWDHFKLFNGQLSVEVSRWGDSNSKNTQFAINPSHEPNNIHRFQTPPGVVTFSFLWQPRKVSFQAWRGGQADSSRPLADHTFKSGVPEPGDEKIHMSLYVYGNSRIPMREPGEVIVERFQFTP